MIALRVEMIENKTKMAPSSETQPIGVQPGMKHDPQGYHAQVYGITHTPR